MSRIVYRLLVLAVAAAIPALSLLTRPAAADPGDRRKPSNAEILRQLANYRSWNIVKKSDNGIGVSLSTFEIKEPTFYG